MDLEEELTEPKTMQQIEEELIGNDFVTNNKNKESPPKTGLSTETQTRVVDIPRPRSASGRELLQKRMSLPHITSNSKNNYFFNTVFRTKFRRSSFKIARKRGSQNFPRIFLKIFIVPMM